MSWKTFAKQAVSEKNRGWAEAREGSFSVAAVFVYLHGAVGLEFVWNLSAVRGLTQDSTPERCQIILSDKFVDFTLPASLCEYWGLLVAPFFFLLEEEEEGTT